jgi:hypothetical protein
MIPFLLIIFILCGIHKESREEGGILPVKSVKTNKICNMKIRLTKVIFTLPFLCVDCIVLPISLIYWIASGKLLEPLTQQLWEAEHE